MKKTLLILSIAMLGATKMYAQGMGVNTTGSAADNSAILDASSTTQGVLLPRMTQAQRDLISSPATGLLIYQTDNTPGFYFYNGGAWTSLSSIGGAAPTGSAGGDLTGTYPNPTVAAGSIKSTHISTGAVTVKKLAAAAPATGQVFTATSDTTAAWSTPSSSSSGPNLGTAAAVTATGSSGNVTADFSAAATGSRIFTVDANGRTATYTLTLTLPASSNYAIGDVVFFTACNQTVLPTIAIQMPGVTKFYTVSSAVALNISSASTTINLTRSSIIMVKTASDTWYMVKP